LCDRCKKQIRWLVDFLNVLKWCWNIKKMKWNTTNSEEEIRHWRMQINEKSEKNDEWSHKVKRSNSKWSLRTHLQNVNSVKQVYNKWRDNNN